MAEEKQNKGILVCSCCGEPVEENSAYTVSNRIFCEDCYEEMTFECEMCGERFLDEDRELWGDMSICPDCLEEFVPSFDEEENDEETAEAYEEMRETYIGRRITGRGCGVHGLEYIDDDSDPAGITYSLTITVDENHVVTDISRLRASIMLWEDVKSSDWRSYPIDPEDYEDKVEAMFDEYDIEFIDTDEDSIDD